MANGIQSAERIVEVGAVELATEAFGDPANPPVLLIMGQMASMLWWPAEFCERLAARGLYVIRYDHRDSGRSSASEPGNPDYTGDDLVEDAVGILDGYGIDRAHIVGMSMGGMLAQLLAARHPRRVATLTLMSTSTAAGGDGLPGPAEEYLAQLAPFENADTTDVDQLTELIVADSRALTGTGRSFDEAETRRFLAEDLGRTRNPASLSNHTLLGGDEVPDDALDRVTAPTLVIHGTSDPLFSVAHAEALVDAIEGARLRLLEGAGHEVHADDWDTIVEAVTAHVRAA